MILYDMHRTEGMRVRLEAEIGRVKNAQASRT
jgi:hypothetical protein